MDQKSQDESWITICGESSRALELEVRTLEEEKITKGLYTARLKSDIASMNMAPVKGDLEISDNELEKLRQLCQVWDIELKPARISSHRKFVGPVIVAVKKALFPMIRFLLKDLIEHQREFNAAVIQTIAAGLEARRRP